MMFDVFISYSRKDYDRVSSIAKNIEASGFTVWWDQRISAGDEFTSEIQKQLENAASVLVIWSEASVQSPWVRDEATLALKERKLIPARIDQSEPPLGFRQFQTSDLSSWNDDVNDPKFQQIVSQFKTHCVATNPSAQATGTIPGHQNKAALSRRVALGSIGAMGAAGALWGILYRRRNPDANLDQVTIAVMPFENLTSEDENRFLARGLSEQVLNALANVNGLQIIASASSFSLVNENLTIPQIGDKLGATLVLNGSVRQQGEQIRVNAELSETAKGRRIWADSYERTAGGGFGLEDDITREIVRALPALIGVPTDQFGVVAASSQRTISIAAQRIFAHAIVLADQSTEDSMRAAIGNFLTAIELEPTYAQAWAELATTAALMQSYAYELPDFSPTPEDAAQKALTFNPGQAEAYAALGLVADRNHNNAAAIKALNKAISIRPSYSSAFSWLAWELILRGDSEKAIDAAKRAVTLNPLAVETAANLALGYATLGEYEQCLVESNRMKELQPDYTTADLYSAIALYHLGEFSQAEKHLQGVKIPWAGDAPATIIKLCQIQRGQPIGSDLAGIEDPFSYGLIRLAQDDVTNALNAFREVKAPLFSRGYWPVIALHNFFQPLFSKIAGTAEFTDMISRVQRYWSMPLKELDFTN